jgi:hypothetical protein
MKAMLVVILVSGGYETGSRYAPTVDSTPMETMEECEAVKAHLLQIMEQDKTMNSIIKRVNCIAY